MLHSLNKKLRNSSLLVLFVLSSLTLSAETLKIDKGHSEVGFSIKHLMISNVKGKFTNYDANIDYDIKTKTFKKFDAYVMTTSIDTGIKKRDDHLRNADFFDVEKYPKLTFVMDKYVKEDNSEGILEGTFTLHGVSKKVKLEVEHNGMIKDFRGNTKLGFTIEGKINRKDFGLTWNKALELGGVAVGDTVKIIIELETQVE